LSALNSAAVSPAASTRSRSSSSIPPIVGVDAKTPRNGHSRAGTRAVGGVAVSPRPVWPSGSAGRGVRDTGPRRHKRPR
jgi:hypothetical protein